MRTRMMALFALIAFCAMPIEAKKVKGNGDIITKEISVRDYSAIKVGSTAMGYSDSWFSLFSRGGKSVVRFRVYARRISVLTNHDRRELISLYKRSSKKRRTFNLHREWYTIKPYPI